MELPPATSLLLNLLCTIIIASSFSENDSTQTCDPGWFGSNCQYKCRCRERACDQGGVCSDGVCDKGWFGPACQFVDLVYEKRSIETPLWTYKGEAITCNQDPSLKHLTVNLSSAFPFSWLRLQVNDPSLLHKIHVTFTDLGNQDIVGCRNMRNATVNETTLDIHCDVDVLVQKVILNGEGVKSLCSIYVSGGRNVALRQNTSQSSTYYNQNSYAAANAVDGKKYFRAPDANCTFTDNRDINTNWTVTLSSSHVIIKYVVYNQFGNSERLKGFTLSSFTTNHTPVFYYTCQITNTIKVYTIMNEQPRAPVSVVNIRANPKVAHPFQSLCEVELYGDSACPPSRYGRECENTCNCAVKDESCFVSTGGCPSGCSAGFQGEACDRVCDFGKYGLDCSSNCSQFCVETNSSRSPCHPTDGACVLGCVSGFQAPKCDPSLAVVKGNESIPVAAVVGSVVAVVILVVVAVFGALLWRRCEKKSHNQSPTDVGDDLSKDFARYEQDKHTEIELNNSCTRSEHKQASSVNEENVTERTTQQTLTKKNYPDTIYCNTGSEMSSTSIAVTDLPSFMNSHNKAFFPKQFNCIPVNINATTNDGMKEENKHKNRYKNICAYDHSRVLLKTSSVKKWGDYINASYIEAYRGQRKFIASQGPTKATLEDFVRMLSEQGVQVVVMLTNLTEDGTVKCERYWPEDDDIQAGDIKVKLKTTQVFADYTIRRLQLLRDGDCFHELTQFHFTAWPDKDVPTTAWSLVDFEQRVASISTDNPIVVHCSAGVGRTGTFIALCNVLVEATETGYMDFFTAVQQLRHDRAYMVQTSDQYEFVHKAALVAAVCMGTTVVSSNITGRIKELTNATDSMESLLDQEFKAACNICDNGSDNSDIIDSSNHGYENSQTPYNKLKNRFQNILPKEDYRVILIGGYGESVGDYINAVFVPSFTKKNQQILTQIPLPSTVTIFWRMVTQCKVTLVVAFELDLGNSDSSIGNYFPSENNGEISCPHFTIKSLQTSSCVLWDEQKLLVSTDSSKTTSNPVSTGSGKEHWLIHIRCKGHLTNQRPEDLLALMKVIRSRSPLGDGRTVYMCRNGAEYSGLVCVLSLLLDRLDNDHHLTVPLVVGAIKAIRPQVIPSIHQYNLLYQVLLLYNDSNNVYSNFGS